MAVGTITVNRQGVIGNLKYVQFSVVGAASYTNPGGDALDISAIGGFSNLLFVDINSLKTAGTTVNQPSWSYDTVNKKLQAFGTAANALGLTEATGATNYANSTINIFALGN